MFCSTQCSALHSINTLINLTFECYIYILACGFAVRITWVKCLQEHSLAHSKHYIPACSYNYFKRMISPSMQNQSPLISYTPSGLYAHVSRFPPCSLAAPSQAPISLPGLLRGWAHPPIQASVTVSDKTMTSKSSSVVEPSLMSR